MPNSKSSRHTWALRTLWLAIVLTLVVGVYMFVRQEPSLALSLKPSPTHLPRMDSGELIVTPELVKSMGLRSEPIRIASKPSTLRFTGQLMLDPNRLVHVTTRFSGEVIQVAPGEKGTPVQVGQQVKRGQLLAVLWSKEIGEKKSDLVDALSQLFLDESVFKKLKVLETPGAISQRTVDEMQRKYESDLIQVERIRRTLNSWRISTAEVEVLEKEAVRIHARAMAGPATSTAGSKTQIDVSPVDSTWANIEIRSPIDGTVLERNLTVGDIVGTDDDLFKVADLTQLKVMANIYEEDLPMLLSLAPQNRNWEIHFNAGERTNSVRGVIETIGNVIDPSQHTAVLQGGIANPDGLLRIGQFVESTLDVPASANALEMPVTAIVDNGSEPFVLVDTKNDSTHWRRQSVSVTRRTADVVWIQSTNGRCRDDEWIDTNFRLQYSPTS